MTKKLYCYEKIKRIWPIIVIIAVWAALVITNYAPGTWLTGWDNLHPEFDFALNIKRSLFAVWQEYQGLGLLGGMGHAADLPRQLMLWAASVVIPAHLLRWVWTFFMLLAGPLGAYALIRSIRKHNLAALTGATFYLLNLATVQVFTAPFDAFVTHYGILPWLLWSNWEFLHAPTRKTLLLVAIINIIGMTHAYIPTLFLVYLIILSILCIATLIRSFHKTTLTRILSLGLVTFCINAFWLLPFIYFTLTNSSITVGAKINQMATQEAYLTNKAFGNIGNVLTLKNFWFDTTDYNPTISTMEPVLGYWRDLERNPWIVWVRYTLTALIVFGGIISLLQKHTRVWGIIGIVIISMVAVDTPPFVWATDWLRDHVPLFSQFFRFPFTKWGIALALFYAVWLGIGSKVLPVIVVLIPTILAITSSIGMLQGELISPKFKLALSNEYFQLFTTLKTLPPGRIANLPQNTYWGWTYYLWGYSGSGFPWYGIENPILDRAFDPWSGYNENYYWEISRSIYSKDAQALEAVLDKYDVRYVLLDENLISPSHNRALFTEEIKAMLGEIGEIREIWGKGKLTLYEAGSTRSDQFVSLTGQLPTVSPAYQWTDNDVAYNELGDYITDSSCHVSRVTCHVFPFRSLFTKRSVDERKFDVEENEDSIIIRSLLFHGPGSATPKKKMDKQENTYEENGINDPGVQIQVNKVNLRQIYHTLFPPYVAASENDTHKPNNDPNQRVNNNKFYGMGFHDQYERSSSQMAAITDTIPSSKLAVNTVDQSPRPENTVGNITSDPTQPAERLVNNPDNTLVTGRDFSADITTTVAGDTYRVNITIHKADALVYDSTKSANLAAEQVKQCGLLRDGTATAQNIDQYLQFTSSNQRGCLSFGVPNLPHRDGYLVAVESRHITGRPLLFSLINQTAKHVELETYLPNNSPLPPLKVRGDEGELTPWTTSYFILPPLAPDGLGYTVYLSNDAIRRQETINDIKSIKFYRITYQKLVSMSLREIASSKTSRNDNVEVEHPNPAYYKIRLKTQDVGHKENQTLILSQSFDPGWTAWETIPTFPYLRRLKNHVLVNNWSNGWRLETKQNESIAKQAIQKNTFDLSCSSSSSCSTIVLFFWPQLLQWLGFALLPLTFLITNWRR